MTIVRIDDPHKFVCMEINEAKTEITAHGYECRIMYLNGRTIHMGLKPDYDPLRVNVWVEKGVVIKATIG